MYLQIDAKWNPVQAGEFQYGNIESRYGANTAYFLKDGKPFFPITGEFHFSRYPHNKWKRELLKMMDCGINAVATYIFWNHHEIESGKFDFSGDNNIAEFLEICKAIQLPCILRIGPWCHGEVRYGGFPDRIAKMVGKRSNNQAYLQEVEVFFAHLQKEVAPYLDGETVLGIQIENEYSGDIAHLKVLRRIAEKVGFKAPFFTMTAWPTNKPDNEFLPTFGGYPDAPWAHTKKQLAPSNRFAITASRNISEIGEDLFKTQKAHKNVFDDIPFACCEIGPGNQVTQHRRPIISEKDGYGTGFAKFASGANWLGYYMFHGGRNPNTALLQESKKTGYPNNYQIIDYDFQAPLSRYGECRGHGDLLRLLHTFIQQFDTDISKKQPFFPKWNAKTPADTSFLRSSVRMDEDMHGYFFACNHDKVLDFPAFKDTEVTVTLDKKSVKLPTITVPADSIFFYPFNLQAGEVLLDYVLAQPIAKIEENGRQRYYFKEIVGIQPSYAIAGEQTDLEINTPHAIENTKVELLVLSDEKARQFHYIDGKAVFAKGTVYSENGQIICETTDGCLENTSIQPIDVSSAFSLEKSGKVKLPYDEYLYSYGKRHYYTLTVDTKQLAPYFDVKLDFSFTGLNLQVFSGIELINDYFNIDGTFTMCLDDYKAYLEKNHTLTIKAVPPTRFGVSHVYSEIPMTNGKVDLKLASAKAIQVLTK